MMSSVRLRLENWRQITSLDNNLVKLYAFPYVPKSKNGIFQKTVIFHFLAVLVCLVYFFLYSKISSIPDFRKLVCPKIENGISQYSKLFQKNEVRYVPKIFWNIPYSKLATHVYVTVWKIPEYSWNIAIY